MTAWPGRAAVSLDGSDVDAALLRRIARRTAVQAALLVAATFLLCGGLVLLVVTVSARRAIDGQLAAAVDRALADPAEAAEPPAGTWLLVLPPRGEALQTPGTPLDLPDRAGLSAVRRGRTSIVSDLDAAHGEFRVRTQASDTPDGPLVVQAAQSLGPQHAERARLLSALAVAGVVALTGAAGLGAFFGRRSVAGLVDTLRRQRTFVADASHELRTPLTVLSTRAQLLRRRIAGLALPEQQRRRLLDDADRLLQDSGHLDEVVEDLLSAAEGVQDQDVVADLAQIAEEEVAGVGALARGTGVRLLLDRTDQPVLVRGGAASLRRSLLAMLDNALRYTPAGGTVTVTVTEAATQGHVQIADTGPGVPVELQPHLFERSCSDSSGAGAGRQRRRYGLGLALVADTAHRFGGSARVDSTTAGSRFTLELPLIDSGTSSGSTGGRRP